MTQINLSTVEECEATLRTAMLNSDITELDRLLSDELRFTNHLGQIVTKEDDLSMHSSGLLNIHEITVLDSEIRIIQGIGLVNARVRIKGNYNNIESDAEFRFSRVWIQGNQNSLQVIMAHSSIVAEQA